MSADKYAQFIAEQQRKLSVSGVNSVDLTEKKHMTKADIAGLKEPKDKIDADDLEALRNKEHLKKEEVEQLDELGPKTLDNYFRKADISRKATNHRAQADKLEGDKTGYKTKMAKSNRRKEGMGKAEVRMVAQRGYKPSKKNPYGAKMPASYLNKEEVELISIEEQTYIEEMVGKGKLQDILTHHKDNMRHHEKMAAHHSDMYDRSMDVGDTRGAAHHEDEGMMHSIEAQRHAARYDHAAGLKAQMNAKRELKSAQAALDAAHKKIAVAKQDKREW